MMARLFLRKAFNNLAFEKYINDINVQRGKFYSKIIIAVEVVMLLLTFFVPEMFSPESLSRYRWHFIVLMSYALVFQVVVKRYNRDKYRLYRILVFMTGLFGMLWGASITLMDLGDGGTMSVYLTFVFMLSIVILTRPDLALLQFVLVQGFFIVNLPSHDRMIEIILNSTVFALFAFAVVRMQYEKAYNTFMKDTLILEKNETLERQNQSLYELSMRDHLTGLYNRLSMDRLIEKQWNHALTTQEEVAFVMMDLDAFKQFNDTYGHIHGDSCLREVGRVLLAITQKHQGFAFRYGGDEFCLLLSGSLDLDQILREVQEGIQDLEFQIDTEVVKVRLSIGTFKTIPDQEMDPWSGVDAADQALYGVKAMRKRRIDD